MRGGQCTHVLPAGMNTTCSDPTAPPPPPPRSYFSCSRHRDEHHTGFCPSCLCERLTTLEHSSSVCSGSAISEENNLPHPSQLPKFTDPASFSPERRRSKSVSASKNKALGLSFEPKRKSCDIKVRNKSGPNSSQKIESCEDNVLVFKELINAEDFRGPRNTELSLKYRIGHVQDSHLERMINATQVDWNGGELVEEEVVSMDNLKPAKDPLNVDILGKNSLGGGFWAVFSKKWHNWRRKHKDKKQSDGEKLSTLSVGKKFSGQYWDTQSEVADYGFGRRSCDTDPRFSLDAGRMRFDDPRYSLEEPQASRNGYLIGRSFPRIAPLEDAPNVHAPQSGMQIPRAGSMDEVVNVPGGSFHTREYYLDSSSRRRKSLDGSSLIKKTGASVVVEILPATEDGERKEPGKFSKWSRRIWGFGNVHENVDVEGKCRSVNWRNGNGSQLASARESGVEINGRKRRESMLEKNRSLQYPPNQSNNGLLRFYLTPIRSSRKRSLVKIKSNNWRTY